MQAWAGAIAAAAARFCAERRGATAIEYVALAAILGVSLAAMLGGSDGTIRVYLEAITNSVAASIASQ